MCERQADNHTGQDAVAIACIPMDRKQKIQIWNMPPNKLAIACIISKIIYHISYISQNIYDKLDFQKIFNKL